MSSTTLRVTLLATAALCLLGLHPGVATASGTGVDSVHQAPPPSAAEARFHAAQEAQYQEWLGQQSGVAGNRAGRAIEVPYYYLYTPSHKQANGYYCGPATCQIVDDFWGTLETQSTYANYAVNGVAMCSTQGTIYGLMDNCLRTFTGKSYDYHGPVTLESDFYSRVSYALFTRHFPGSLLMRINAASMDNYTRDHAGHIVCFEAFDWRLNASNERTVRLNDPYNEADYWAGGGNTYGHKVYPRVQLWRAVAAEPSHAMIY